MIIDLIDKLVDRVIQLAKQHKEIHRNLFEDFVEPAYSLFQAIHEEYLKSFETYRDTIESARDFTSLVDTLCATIRKDNLFTEHHRANLRALADAKKTIANDQSLGSFCNSIWVYLYEGVAFVHGTEGTSDDVHKAILAQVYRNGLFNALKAISARPALSDQERRGSALEELDEIVAGMQGKAWYVTHCYAELKAHLLK